MIYVPPPDYSSRQVLWTQLIAQESGKMHSDTDVPSLAKISEGYSAGAVPGVNLFNSNKKDRISYKRHHGYK